MIAITQKFCRFPQVEEPKNSDNLHFAIVEPKLTVNVSISFIEVWSECVDSHDLPVESRVKIRIQQIETSSPSFHHLPNDIV
jgi:hypothetical protein